VSGVPTSKLVPKGTADALAEGLASLDVGKFERAPVVDGGSGHHRSVRSFSAKTDDTEDDNDGKAKNGTVGVCREHAMSQIKDRDKCDVRPCRPLSL
jgi:hypothetical protein